MFDLTKSKVDNMSDEELKAIKNKEKCYDGPITGNIKCIIISIALALFYWYAPPKNKYVLLLILYVTYLLIAYYDFFYDCRKGQFGPTFLKTYYDWAKPRNTKQNILYSNLCDDNKRLILIVDIIVFIGILAITPTFLRWKPNKG
jgi:hypothetical protein